MITLTYAGIGSRRTPLFVRNQMTNAARQMAQNGWWLRSGYAEGADQAWGLGAAQRAEQTNIDKWTMYLPWAGYNRAPYGDNRFVVPEFTDELRTIAAFHHYRWDELSEPVRKLMMRNVAIVLGPDTRQHVDCVLCWTNDGKASGGTGHAMRVARYYNIPVFNLANEEDRKGASAFVYDNESVYWDIPW